MVPLSHNTMLNVENIFEQLIEVKKMSPYGGVQ